MRGIKHHKELENAYKQLPESDHRPQLFEITTDPKALIANVKALRKKVTRADLAACAKLNKDVRKILDYWFHREIKNEQDRIDSTQKNLEAYADLGSRTTQDAADNEWNKKLLLFYSRRLKVFQKKRLLYSDRFYCQEKHARKLARNARKALRAAIKRELHAPSNKSASLA